ncbi:fragment of conserved hypothetical protein (part 1) [Bradyrhizobium sp. STM 3843]|nr:fragment of conserved hypothetical protein (part 1) [Bradyrhizobium sp. STM 3843]
MSGFRTCNCLREEDQMRSDPYRERARELAVEAGLDPDAKIDRPGQRPMPLWCTFHDAARKEQLARDAEALANTVAGRPQAAEYQNSPLKVFGQHEDATLAQMRNCMAVGNAVAGVICADGHLGYAQPVGGVIAYEKQISISGVGFDIGCGNMAVRLDTQFSEIENKVGAITQDVAKVISFGVGRKNAQRVEHELFDDADAWRESDMGEYRQKAVGQLGTVGSGNHYVDLMRDEAGFVWIGVHFGSRGLGHTSATRYLKAAGGKDGMTCRRRRGLGARAALHRRDAVGGALCLCRTGVGGRARARDHRRRRHGHGAQPPQLRLARDPWRQGPVGRPQGGDAGLSWPARLRRRLDGGRCRHHRGRGVRGGEGFAVLDGARGRAAVRAAGSQAAFHPRRDGRVAAGPGRYPDRGRPRRESDGLSPSAGGDRRARGLGEGASHLASVRGGDGRRGRVRSVQGLSSSSRPIGGQRVVQFKRTGRPRAACHSGGG